MLDKPSQPRMINLAEKVADVRIEHPVHPLPLDPDREGVQRIMRAAPRPEPIRETPEVHLVDGVEHLDDRPLNDLVLQRRDPQRPQATCANSPRATRKTPGTVGCAIPGTPMIISWGSPDRRPKPRPSRTSWHGSCATNSPWNSTRTR